MKKVRFGYLALLAMLLLGGCAGRKNTGTGGYQIYCTNMARSRLITEAYTPQNTASGEILDELLKKFSEPQLSLEHYSVLPENVQIEDYTLTDGQLTVTFGRSYLNMDNAQEILVRSALVLTVSQLADVRTVVFHIGEDDVLKDSAGEPVGAMTSSMFINSPVGINSYQYASLSLYFSNRAGDKVVREMRNVHYSSNTTLEHVVMEQLLKGPMNQQLRPILGTDVTLLGVTKEDNLCTVNLSREFLNKKNVSGPEPEVTIYSMVNSLCDMLNVDRVQFQVEGESNVLYQSKLSLNGPFHRNSALIETVESTERGADVTEADPSIGL